MTKEEVLKRAQDDANRMKQIMTVGMDGKGKWVYFRKAWGDTSDRFNTMGGLTLRVDVYPTGMGPKTPEKPKIFPGVYKVR